MSDYPWMNQIETGVLRDITKDAARIGEHTVTPRQLLRRTGLDEPLHDVRKHIRWAELALHATDVDEARRHLSRADTKLGRLLEE